MSAFISPNIRTIFDREPTDIFDVCTRVCGIGIPIKRLTRRYAVAIKWRYGNTWVDFALIYEPLILCQEKVQIKNDFFPSCQHT